MSQLDSPYGYALRRSDTCLSNEVDCGQTWAPFHACCPHGTICPPQSSSSSICCPAPADCGALLQGHPHCGNITANLYFADNYFCCADGEWGFELNNGYVGCVSNVSELGSGTKQLAIVSEGSSLFRKWCKTCSHASCLLTDVDSDGSNSNLDHVNLCHNDRDYAFTNAYVIQLHYNTDQYCPRNRVEYSEFIFIGQCRSDCWWCRRRCRWRIHSAHAYLALHTSPEKDYTETRQNYEPYKRYFCAAQGRNTVRSRAGSPEALWDC